MTYSRNIMIESFAVGVLVMIGVRV
jgi:hypothetical protein